MESAADLLVGLKMTGTGEMKLEFIRDLLSENPDATAEDALHTLEVKNAPEGTLDKARRLLAGADPADLIEPPPQSLLVKQQEQRSFKDAVEKMAATAGVFAKSLSKEETERRDFERDQKKLYADQLQEKHERDREEMAEFPHQSARPGENAGGTPPDLQKQPGSIPPAQPTVPETEFGNEDDPDELKAERVQRGQEGFAVRRLRHAMTELHSSEEICEALVRHVETNGAEAFSKNFVVDGVVQCTVWCIVGPHAEAFYDMATEWMESQGYDTADD